MINLLHHPNRFGSGLIYVEHRPHNLVSWSASSLTDWVRACAFTRRDGDNLVATKSPREQVDFVNRYAQGKWELRFTEDIVQGQFNFGRDVWVMGV